MILEISQPRVLRFGSFEVSLASRELRKQGMRVKLQDQPLAVLCLLLEHPGEVVQREEIRQKIWQTDTFVDFDVGINNAIKKIRQALGDSAESPQFIETIPRHGYRFAAPVEAIDANAKSSSKLEAALPDAAPPSTTHRIRPLWALTVVIPVVVISYIYFWWHRWEPSRSKSPTAPSIVVLPFEDLSSTETSDYFGEAMADAIITNLAQFSDVRVISRTSAMQYRRTQKTVRQIGNELGVTAVLEGSVLRTGSRIRIDVQLIDVTEDRHIWAHSYERDLSDILVVQQEVASGVVRQIAERLTPSSGPVVRATRVVNPKAYEAYLKARYYTNHPGPLATADTVQSAITHYEEALRNDRDYAPAYAGLASAYFQLGFEYFTHTLSPADSMRLAETAAQKAIALDAVSPDGHLVLGRIRLAQWRWREAEQELRRAIELDPANSDAYAAYSGYFVSTGQMNEAIAILRRALERDPLDVNLHDTLSWWLFQAHRYDDSLQECRASVNLRPENPRHRCFARAFEEQGKYTEAIQHYRKLTEIISDPNANANAELARALARSGQRTEAEQIVKRLAALQRPDTAYLIATVYAALGAPDAAFGYLDKAFSEHSGWLVLVKVEPPLDALRNDLRFTSLVHRMGLDSGQ
jgi:TolB-like protein/DNA-binding winged helix-turn-helix (wHTH) protein/Tfp pilus assembly protein PilF